MAIRTLYGFDEDGNKIAVGSYDTSVTVTLISDNSAWQESLTGGGQYEIGASCTISGPAGHVRVEYWKDENDNIISYNNPYTFTVTNSITIYAHIIVGGTNN